MKNMIIAVGVALSGVVAVAYAADKGAAAQPSCGQMMAEHAVIPAKLAETVVSLADMLDVEAAMHVALKSKDATAEADGLKAIAKQHRDLATVLTKSAEMTKAAANWPNVPHDMAKFMADPKLKAAMTKFMTNQKDLIALMQKDLAQAEAMNSPKMN